MGGRTIEKKMHAIKPLYYLFIFYSYYFKIVSNAYMHRRRYHLFFFCDK